MVSCIRAALTQAGRDAFGAFEFDRAANLDVIQVEHGNVGLVFQGGW